MKKWTYQDRWGLITGASAGFGEAFARALARRGMHVVLTARREDRLRALADELSAEHGIHTHIVPLDLSEPGTAERLWNDATRAGDIHLLINNAGIGAHGPFHTVPRERLVQLVQLNCTALLELTHLALQGMRERGEGGIINLGSSASFQPVPIVATYAATKAFVLSLTQAVWAENRDVGVRVLALTPGRSPTEFQSVAGTSRVSTRMPGILPAEKIVESGLRALEKGRSYEIPGIVNFAGTFASRLLPRGFLASTMLKINKRLI